MGRGTVARVLWLLLLTVQSSCIWGLRGHTAQAVGAIDAALSTLQRESSDWRAVLADLRQRLAEEGQPLAANEVKVLLQRGGDLAELSDRCGGSFVLERMVDGLFRVRAHLLEQPVPRSRPFFCDVTPEYLELSELRHTRQVVTFYGDDVDVTDPKSIRVVLVERNGHERDVTAQNVAILNAHKLMLNVAANGILLDSESSKVVLRWRDGRDLTSILITQRPPRPSLEPQLLHRLYNAGSGDHFYTASDEERDRAITDSGYRSEGDCCQLLPTQAPESVVLYRLYNPTNGDHFYTTDTQERLSAMKGGYRPDGKAGFVYLTQVQGTVPLYRMYKPSNGDHFYTLSADEKGPAAHVGYVDDGITAYVFPIESQAP